MKNLRKSFENRGIPVIVEKEHAGGRKMIEEYKTLLGSGEGELVEKKSRFLAAAMHIDTEEEALAFIEQIRKKHYNATHNCYAYVLGEHFELQRFSDDGEPGGTAGKPILDVLTGEEIHDTVIVVTRYFGGTLLGTGGLVRAYSGAAREALLASTIITRKHAVKLEIQTEYTGLGKIQYILGQNGIHILDTQYTEKVVIECLVVSGEKGRMEKELTEGTNGQAELTWKEECYFADSDGEIQVFDQ